MEGLTIGQIAKEAGVGVETVRFYERKGLVTRPERPWRSFRRYPPETVTRIRFLRQAKGLGFTLKEAAELLALRVEAGSPCEEVRKRAQAKLAVVKVRISELQAMRAALERLVGACEERRPTACCPILETLEGEGRAERTPPRRNGLAYGETNH